MQKPLHSVYKTNFFTLFISKITMALFILSLISGIIVVFDYHPFDAFNSIQKLNYIIPFGAFIRQIHYFSSELFTIFLIIHIIIELSKKEIFISFSSWSYSVLATLILFILMFTGFVLKADQESNAAALVAFSLIKDTPILDKFLPLFQDNISFYWKFFIWHIVFLPLILIFGVYKHVNSIKVNIRYFTISIAITLLIMLFISIPSDIPLDIEVSHLKGPWFFWGAENLLQIGFTPLVINIILCLPFIFLLLIYNNN